MVLAGHEWHWECTDCSVTVEVFRDSFPKRRPKPLFRDLDRDSIPRDCGLEIARNTHES